MVGKSLVQSTSFSARGIPSKGVRSPEFSLRSASLAWSRALSPARARKALTFSSTEEILSRRDLVSSREVISLWSKRRLACHMVSSQSSIGASLDAQSLVSPWAKPMPHRVLIDDVQVYRPYVLYKP